MARIRTIKPGFFANEGLSEVSEAAQILAGGLLCYADDEGYFNAHPALVKAAVFPLRRNISEHDTADFMRELARIGYARFGMGKDGRRYGWIVNFSEHQKVSHAIPSKIKDLVVTWEIPENSGEVPEGSRSLPPELNRTELNRTEVKPSARKARGVNNTQIAKAVVETRHSRLQQIVMGWYLEWAGVECPWDGGEGRNLKRMLDSTPNWPDVQFVTCLDNLAKSDCVPKGERPREWVEKLPKFLHGPLDRFWKPIGSNGNGQVSSAAAREQRIRERTDRVLASISGGTSAALPNGNGGRGVPRLAANPEILPAAGSDRSSERIDAESAGGMDGPAKAAGHAAGNTS